MHIKDKVKVGTREFPVNVTQFETIEQATKSLGETKVLEYINYAQRLHDRNEVRRKYTK